MKRIVSFIIIMTLLLGMTTLSFAADLNDGITIGEEDNTGATFILDENGSFEVELKDGATNSTQIIFSSGRTGKIIMRCQRDSPYSYNYRVYYEITTNFLFNIIEADRIRVRETTYLFPETFIDKSIYANAHGATRYTGYLGSFTYEDDLDQVRVIAESFKVYDMSNPGWVYFVINNPVVDVE